MPDGVDEASVRRQLLNNFSIEIGAGHGELKGDIWRIGLMGCSCNPKHVMTVLSGSLRSTKALRLKRRRIIGAKRMHGSV